MMRICMAGFKAAQDVSSLTIGSQGEEAGVGDGRRRRIRAAQKELPTEKTSAQP